MRALGLGNIGRGVPITPFLDDYAISTWARQEIQSAVVIGIIRGDDTGRINPQEFTSKAEASVIIYQLADYMRTRLQEGYMERIINFLS